MNYNLLMAVLASEESKIEKMENQSKEVLEKQVEKENKKNAYISEHVGVTYKNRNEGRTKN